ncbi:hypothetical protein M8J76_008501 [Diaphorina citri]|nr:hypothetical protein M8J76_008501 [Diaphorina citri]
MLQLLHRDIDQLLKEPFASQIHDGVCRLPGATFDGAVNRSVVMWAGSFAGKEEHGAAFSVDNWGGQVGGTGVESVRGD